MTKNEFKTLKIGDMVSYGTNFVGYLAEDTTGFWPFRVHLLEANQEVMPRYVGLGSSNCSNWKKLT